MGKKARTNAAGSSTSGANKRPAAADHAPPGEAVPPGGRARGGDMRRPAAAADLRRPAAGPLCDGTRDSNLAPKWDPSHCSASFKPDMVPVTVKWAPHVHWQQTTVYVDEEATWDHVKYTIQSRYGAHVSSFRMQDGFSGEPLNRFGLVEGLAAIHDLARAGEYPMEHQRISVVVPSFA